MEMDCLLSLYLKLRKQLKNNLDKEIVVVCIGTDRSTGDSFGPFVGTYLMEAKLTHIKVYGTIDEPVHAMNLEETLQSIQENHPNALVIAVDACLSKVRDIGKLKFKNEAIKPGEAFDKKLSAVGDCSFVGIVNVNGFMEFYVLQNTRLSLVLKMAKECAGIIKRADQYLIRKYQSSNKETVYVT
jgi:putative sporulation protein YyaC